MTALSEQFARGVVFARWWLLVLAVGLVIPAYFTSQQLSYDRSIENMFSPSDPVLVDFRRFERVFGKDQIVLLVYKDPALFSEDGSGIARSREITRRVRDIEGVADVLSVSVLDRMLGRLRTSILNSEDRLAATFRELFNGYTHSSDGRVAADVCILDQDLPRSPKKLQAALDGLRDVASNLPNGIEDGVLVGEPVMVSDGFRYVEQDGKRLGILSTVLLGITMLVCLRSVRWVLIALAVVTWSTIVTQAMLVWGGWQLSMVSSMLSANITVVGVATVMHVALGSRDGIRSGLDPKTALRKTISLLGAPIFWAVITDAIGFMALLAAHAGPIRDYGFMMTLGSLVVLVAAILIVPAPAIAGERLRKEQAGTERPLERALAALLKIVERHPRPSLAILAVAFAIGVSGMLMMKVETDFTRNFRSTSPIATAYEFAEENLGGAGVWDVMVPAPKTLTNEYLERVERFEQSLRNIRLPGGEPALTKVLSLVDVLQASEERRLLAQIPAEIRAVSMSKLMPDFLGTLRAQDRTTRRSYLRIMLRAHDRRDAAGKQWLIAEVKRLANQHFGSDKPARPIATGPFVLLTNLVTGILRDQWICFFVALAGVGLAVTIALRSIWMAVLVVIVNTLPVCLLLGVAGWFGVRMNLGVAMIGAVSMGLSVDNALHYLYAFRRAMQQGSSFELALNEAHQSSGRALIYSTIALATGFASLSTGHFLPTAYFGALSALTLVISVFCNLTVLPLLLGSFRSIRV